jgi:hypothetical protein
MHIMMMHMILIRINLTAGTAACAARATRSYSAQSYASVSGA